MENKMDRMRELVSLLNKASEAYYAKDEEIMSNFEYDRLYDELTGLERDLGVTLADSPTVQVGYEAVDELPKERHESAMLSLAKTKNREELADWLNGKEGLLSWKLDGLTIVLTYREGTLQKAVTRGNGEVGEVVTGNARMFRNLPLNIPYKGELILRGEAVITYSGFAKINREIEDEQAKYKNPRNLCSGSVRQLDNRITAERGVRFYAFSLVRADVDFHNSRTEQSAFLQKQGFDVVEYRLVTPENILDNISYFEEKIQTYDVPSDGLVLTYEDMAYGASLGRTAKFPRDSIAFKWADELRETTLVEMEWSASRTGLINPVAIFEPVELEGTTVSRASVHNISIVRGLKLGIGDRITVYKANMIIPQIARNLTKSGIKDIPSACPVCGEPTEIRKVSNAKALYCTNPECQAKHVKAFALFVSRDALNIEGLSEATLEKFIARGFIREFSDIFHLDRHCEEIRQMEGFGEKSYNNLIASIEKARVTTLPRVVYSLGIAGIGLANAKVICKEFNNDVDAMLHADEEMLNAIDGIGGVLAGAFVSYFKDEHHIKILLNLLKELEIPEEIEDNTERILEGKKFVITGSVTHFANRGEIKELIESLGGKVTGSVTAKTDFLINNDVHSTSSKNKKANELNIPIISEEEFIELTRRSS